MLAGVAGIGAVVDDALRVVRIAGARAAGVGIGEAAGELRMLRVLQVHHVEPAAAGLAAAAGAHDERVAGHRVDRDVVRAVDAAVVGVLRELLRRGARAPEPGEVEDLHAVLARAIGHDEDVVPVDLEVAPDRRRRRLRLRQAAEVAGTVRVRDVDERRAVGPADEGVLLARLRIGPAPDVVDLRAAAATDLLDRQERKQRRLLAIEHPGLAAGAGDVPARDGGRAHHRRGEGALAPGAAGVTGHDGREPFAPFGVRNADDGHVLPGDDAPAAEAHLPGRVPVEPAHRGERRRITGTAVAHDGALELAHAGRADPELVADPRERHPELGELGGLERHELRVRPPGVGRAVVAERDHDAKVVVEARRADVDRLPVDEHRLAEARLAHLGREAGHAELRVPRPPVAGAPVDVCRADVRVGPGGPDDEHVALDGHRPAEGGVRRRAVRKQGRVPGPGAGPGAPVDVEGATRAVGAGRADQGEVALHRERHSEAVGAVRRRDRRGVPPRRRGRRPLEDVHDPATGEGGELEDHQGVAVRRDRPAEAVAEGGIGRREPAGLGPDPLRVGTVEVDEAGAVIIGRLANERFPPVHRDGAREILRLCGARAEPGREDGGRAKRGGNCRTTAEGGHLDAPDQGWDGCGTGTAGVRRSRWRRGGRML